ncbi:molybdopterin molybdotransferase MoeA [Actinocorallia sp. API 0066]|uniref:molybdopterin molybdotransferase MoeA n=1 Tax=Actinocorallia sp. API 0066 TaxID=2896846 RepID=UPI001E38BD28|nr:molybdopterin molybdotransferase MoeA [Actinocorallia sp. API 0066]MCD0452985.1 molybdopterin molybdotransferase MoeA [Actinocorallia sp. API 0066]
MTLERETCRDVAWAEARLRAHGAAAPLPPVRVGLGGAAGAVLAEDVVTATPLPAFDTAAMDGFAIAGPGPWRIVGDARPGRPWASGTLPDGCAIGISTGSVVPPGARAVLPVEHAGRTGDALTGPLTPDGKHIRRAGEDAAAGTCLVPAGTRVGPALVGLAASCGHDDLLVRRTPKVAALVTGDELVRHGRPGPGRIRDALGPMLPSLVASLGGDLTDVIPVPDHPETALRDAVAAASTSDVIVVTGSTSVGVTDGLRRLLADARWIVDGVACRPGHPQLLARPHDAPYVVGLPGNPFAALVAAHTLLGPLLCGLTARPLPDLPHAPLAAPVLTTPGRTRIVPVVWAGSAVLPLPGDRPASLHAASQAHALAAVPPDPPTTHPVPLLLL